MPLDKISIAFAAAAPTIKEVTEVLTAGGPVASYATGLGLAQMWPMIEGMQ
jgi:hypothetical protein